MFGGMPLLQYLGAIVLLQTADCVLAAACLVKCVATCVSMAMNRVLLLRQRMLWQLAALAYLDRPCTRLKQTLVPLFGIHWIFSLQICWRAVNLVT